MGFLLLFIFSFSSIYLWLKIYTRQNKNVFVHVVYWGAWLLGRADREISQRQWQRRLRPLFLVFSLLKLLFLMPFGPRVHAYTVQLVSLYTHLCIEPFKTRQNFLFILSMYFHSRFKDLSFFLYLDVFIFVNNQCSFDVVLYSGFSNKYFVCFLLLILRYNTHIAESRVPHTICNSYCIFVINVLRYGP